MSKIHWARNVSKLKLIDPDCCSVKGNVVSSRGIVGGNLRRFQCKSKAIPQIHADWGRWDGYSAGHISGKNCLRGAAALSLASREPVMWSFAVQGAGVGHVLAGCVVNHQDTHSIDSIEACFHTMRFSRTITFLHDGGINQSVD